MKTTAVKRANKRLHIENKAEDNIASTCKLCVLYPACYKKVKPALEMIQWNRKHLRKQRVSSGLSETSFGHKESHIPAAKIAVMVLEASSLYHARTTQQHSKGKHMQSATIITGNNTSLNAILFGLIPLGLKIPRKKAFLMLLFS